MKGLLIKELYMVKKYGKGYALGVAIYVALSLSGDDSVMSITFPCALAALFSITLLVHDERSKWTQYCGTLPYSKAQIVSAKYLTGLSVQITVLLLIGMAQAVGMTSKGTFNPEHYLLKMSVALILSLAMSSASLLCIFRFGAETGQIIFSVIMGVICALLMFFMMATPGLLAQELPSASTLLSSCLITIALYALSWYLSIVLYKKRENI